MGKVVDFSQIKNLKENEDDFNESSSDNITLNNSDKFVASVLDLEGLVNFLNLENEMRKELLG